MLLVMRYNQMMSRRHTFFLLHARSPPLVRLDLSFCAFVPRIVSSRSRDRAVFSRTEVYQKTTSCSSMRTQSLRPGKIAVCYICRVPSPMNADPSQRRALKRFITVPQCQVDTFRPKFSRISLIYSTTMSKHSGVAALPQNRGSNAHGSASSPISNFTIRCTCNRGRTCSWTQQPPLPNTPKCSPSPTLTILLRRTRGGSERSLPFGASRWTRAVISILTIPTSPSSPCMHSRLHSNRSTSLPTACFRPEYSSWPSPSPFYIAWKQ